MDFDTLCHNLQVPSDSMEKLRPLWIEDGALEQVPSFLTPDFFNVYREELSLSCAEIQIVDRLVQKVYDTACSTPALAAFCNRVFQLLFVESGDFSAANLPEFETLLGEACGIPALLICLGAMPLVAEKYTALGLPEKYHSGPIGWIAGTIRIYQAGSNGRYGQFFSQTYWLRHSVRGELFRIGRFEFQIRHDYHWHLPFFRNEQKEYLLFADPAWLIDQDGFQTDTISDGVWMPHFYDDGGMLEGFPVDPASGTVSKDKIRVESARWEPVLAPHSFCLHLHIPGGGGMTPEVAESSFKEALEFFRTYFHREVAAFVCYSWILNPDWQRVLPVSNIAELQRKVFLFPAGVDSHSGLFFVFGRTDDDFASYPADNTLRRAFHQIWNEGGTLRPGCMILPTEFLKD